MRRSLRFYGRGEEALEIGTGIGCADCFFKTVSVCTLSDGRAGWTDPGTHCRIFGKPAGSLAHGKKRELPGGCLTGGKEEMSMLSVLFTILMIGIFGKLIGFAFHAAWGLTKVVCTLVVLPVVLIVLVVAGFVALALPVLVIVGIVALGMGVFSRR